MKQYKLKVLYRKKHERKLPFIQFKNYIEANYILIDFDDIWFD